MARSIILIYKRTQSQQHRIGVLHRTLKPNGIVFPNILSTRSGTQYMKASFWLMPALADSVHSSSIFPNSVIISSTTQFPVQQSCEVFEDSTAIALLH